MKCALTGGIGSGKSYVCRRLMSYGVEVFDCDASAKRLMKSDRELQKRLSEAVGQDVFPGGRLDKALLSKFLLASEENNKIVNGIVHPAVAEDFQRSGMQWMESAILFEADFRHYVDIAVCVSAPLEVRIERVMQRDGISREKALEWINRQIPQEEKERLSEYVIVNDGIADIDRQLEELLKKLRTE